MAPGISEADAGRAHDTFGHVPGVGPSLSIDLWELGFRSMQDLAAGDPEAMYQATREQAGGTMDRCVLYVYRCAVAYANDPDLDPALQKWWSWKD